MGSCNGPAGVGQALSSAAGAALTGGGALTQLRVFPISYLATVLASAVGLAGYESLADSMQKAMGERLWDDSLGYLINYNGAKKDTHYYMGSLLAAAYDLLSPDRTRRLLETANAQLMAPAIGVRTAMPPDFQTQESKAFYKFQGDEAGQPYLYINGGVWPHSNAWYALALVAAGKTDEALSFVKSTMTVEGIMRSPMGQPAMYEYRYTDPASKEYGRVDKPSFLWAGGFYLKTLYALAGVKENEWNISFSPAMPASIGACHFSLTFGSQKDVTKKSSLPTGVLSSSGVSVPSMVLPLDLARESAPKLSL